MTEEKPTSPRTEAGRAFEDALRSGEGARRPIAEWIVAIERAAAAATPSLDGSKRITDERQRQIEVEGYDPVNDANDHDPEDMEQAALAYLLDEPDRWPWANSPKYGPTRVRELEKAGALIAAAIDMRLYRGEG